MVDEEISLVFKADRYYVDVKYSFYNYDDDTTLTVGFPQWYLGPYAGSEANLDHFTFYLFDKQIPYKVIKSDKASDTKNEGYSVQFKKWYYTQIIFPKEQVVVLRNTYDCEYGSSGPYHFLEYLYGTGNNWYNSINSVRVKLDFQYSYWVTGFGLAASDEKRPYSYEQLSKTQYLLVMRNVKPQDNDTIWFTLLAPDDSPFAMGMANPFIDNKGNDFILKDDELDDYYLMFLTTDQLKIFKYFLTVAIDKNKKINTEYSSYFRGIENYRNSWNIEKLKSLNKNIAKVDLYLRKKAIF